MKKTTVYLPEELERELERAARDSGRSKSELIRAGIEAVVAREAPRPRGPLFSSGDPTFARRADELLDGFGED